MCVYWVSSTLERAGCVPVNYILFLFCCLYDRFLRVVLGRVEKLTVVFEFFVLLILLLPIITLYPIGTRAASRKPVLVIASCGPRAHDVSSGLSTFVSRCERHNNGCAPVVRDVGYGGLSRTCL